MNAKLPLTLANRLNGIKNYSVGLFVFLLKKKNLLVVFVNLVCSRKLSQRPPYTHGGICQATQRIRAGETNFLKSNLLFVSYFTNTPSPNNWVL